MSPSQQFFFERIPKVDDGCILVYQGKVQKNATSSKNVEEKVMLSANVTVASWGS